MIAYLKNGSILMVDEKNLSRTQLLPAGTTAQDIEAAIAAFDPSPAPSVQDGPEFRIGPFVAACAAEGVFTPAKGAAILNRLKR